MHYFFAPRDGGWVAEQVAVVGAGPDSPREAVLIVDGERAGRRRGGGEGSALRRHGGNLRADHGVPGRKAAGRRRIGRARREWRFAPGVVERALERVGQRSRNLPFTRGGPRIGEVVDRGRGREEQRDLATGRIEHVHIRLSGHGDRRPADDWEAHQPPDEHEQLGNSHEADGALPAPEVGRMKGLVERAAGQHSAVRRAQVNQPASRGPGQQSGELFGGEQRGDRVAGGPRERARPDGRVETVTGATQPPQPLARPRGPAGDVAAQLLDDLDGPLAISVVDRLGNVETLATRIDVVDQVGREQIADVGDHPVRARLDRLVLPQLVDAAPDDGHLASDPVDQLAQRPDGVDVIAVSRAVHGGQELPEPLCVVGVEAVDDVSHLRSLR